MKTKLGDIDDIQAAMDKMDEMRSDDPDVDFTSIDDPQVQAALEFAQSLMPKRSKELDIDEKMELLRTYLDSMGESYG
ncbi:MAG: hypothetical protein ABIQ44_07895 [Chloroflexia bacterium]